MMRRDMSPMERRAVRRMLTGIHVPTTDHGGDIDPVEYADAMTSMADARAALNLARGALPGQIDSLGYRRQSWAP